MLRTSEYPEIGDLVICSVQNVKNFGAFVSLDEYGNKEGFIHIAEVATGWIKYIRDYVREGQKVVCKVLKVDESKGHVDLSLKQVNEHQRREKIQEWKNEQKAEKLLEMVGERSGMGLEELYEEVGSKMTEDFGSLYRAFEEVSLDESMLKEEGYKGKWTKEFIQVAKENIVPPEVSIDAYVEVTCPLPDGVDHIRGALAQAEQSDHVSIKVQYIGAPRYRLVVNAPDYKLAEDELQAASDRIIKYIEAHEGKAKYQRKE